LCMSPAPGSPGARCSYVASVAPVPSLPPPVSRSRFPVRVAVLVLLSL
jgi:hypothetical protein